MSMDYNTQREHLAIPEYGRNVQKMVKRCLTIEDRHKRNLYAKSIIVAMSNVNPTGKDSPNYQRRLWDHLFIISDYQLDIDSPYPKPVREEKNAKPSPLKYSGNNIRVKTYGMFLQKMIDKVSSMPECLEKRVLTDRIAHEMKKAHLQWNINTCDDEVILKHLELLSDGKLKVSDNFQFKTTKDILGKKPNVQKNQQNKKVNKNNNNKRK